MRLVEALKVSVSPVLLDRLDAIDTHDFSGVKRTVRQELAKRGIVVDDTYLNDGVFALKQYYALATIDARNMHAISEALDPFWHAHILHSEQYTSLCNDIVGRFLHHRQSDHAKKDDMDFVCQVYGYTMKRYAECFTAIDGRFHIANPPRDEHPCVHMGDVNADFAMFPVAPEAQPKVTTH